MRALKFFFYKKLTLNLSLIVMSEADMGRAEHEVGVWTREIIGAMINYSTIITLTI